MTMGSWEETCGLSGLPITRGDKALLFLLVPGTALDGHSGFSYPVGLWMPTAPPFFGKYDDDRGTLDFAKKPPAHWPLTSELLKDMGLSWRDNDTDDWQPLPLAYNYGKFFEKIERGWVQGKTARFSSGKFSLGQMLVRQDIWDTLLGMKFETWYGEAEREQAHADAREFIQYVLDHPPKEKDLSWPFSVERHFEQKVPSVFFSSIFHPGESGPSLGRYRVAIMHGLVNKSLDAETAQAILYEIADLAHVNRMMSHLRRAWGPQSGKGSQDINYELHAAFLRKAAEIAEREAKKLEE
jgi:hypothetical protein